MKNSARNGGVPYFPLAGCSKRPSSKAAASEEARRTLRYVEPLSDARTMLADFFSILPDRLREDEHPGSRIASGFQFL
jgi:hypothetical protein